MQNKAMNLTDWLFIASSSLFSFWMFWLIQQHGE